MARCCRINCKNTVRSKVHIETQSAKTCSLYFGLEKKKDSEEKKLLNAL